MTPNSSPTPYLTVNDFLARNDWRDVGQLVNDDNTESDPSELQTNPNLAVALASASGDLERACLSSQKYSVADLQALNGMSLEYMKSIISGVAMYRLYQRRHGPQPSDFVVESYRQAMEALDQLRSGVAIFSFTEVEAAGNPTTQEMNVGDWTRLNLLSFRWTRMFGVRNTYQGAGTNYGNL